MQKEDCIFCKIANGEIPSKTIYNDDMFRIILDLSPASKGHALILPKDHYADLWELPEDLAADTIKLAQKISAKIKKELNCDGFNLLQNNGEAAGQTIFHFHMHLIPRYSENEKIISWKTGTTSQEELEETRQRITGEKLL